MPMPSTVGRPSRGKRLLRGRNGMLVAGVALAGFGLLFAAVKARRSEAIDVAITLQVQARSTIPWCS